MAGCHFDERITFSDVEEMKSTIGQQIIIKKVGDGRSKVKSVIK